MKAQHASASMAISEKFNPNCLLDRENMTMPDLPKVQQLGTDSRQSTANAVAGDDNGISRAGAQRSDNAVKHRRLIGGAMQLQEAAQEPFVDLSHACRL